MAVILRLSLFLAFLRLQIDAGCPELATLRSDTVTSSLNLELLQGEWFEMAYQDPAQIGTSCQHINNTAQGDSIIQRFSCQYGKIPFSQQYIYDPQADLGVYTKHLVNSKLLELPTVVVDVYTDPEGEEYQYMTEFTCISVGITETELRFLSRSRTVNSTQLDIMKQAALSLGIDPKLVAEVKLASQSNCTTV